MTKQEKASFISDELQKRYPETETFLHFSTDWQLLFAIILSAQATDTSVNQATEVMFSRLPSLKDYNEENRQTIQDCIKKVGLGKSKTEYLIKTARELIEKYDGKVPTDREKLMKLSGVGFKTSGVFLGEFYNIPFIPVDTHVYRVTHRLGLVKDDLTADETEIALEKLYKNKASIHLHRQFILFGRNVCFAKSPLCSQCPFVTICKFQSKKRTSQE